MCSDEKQTFLSSTADVKNENALYRPLRGLEGYTVKSLLDGSLKLIPYSIKYKYR